LRASSGQGRLQRQAPLEMTRAHCRRSIDTNGNVHWVSHFQQSSEVRPLMIFNSSGNPE
jgi:hypothetical protein